MHTMIRLEAGVLETSVQGAPEGVKLSRRRWEALVMPAITILRALGGGTMLLPHHPGELT